MGRNKNLNDVLSGYYGDGYEGSSSVVPFTGSGYKQKFDWGDEDLGIKGGGDFKSSGEFHQCYKAHPPLKLPGTELVIYGGSCIYPAVSDADVYIGFDQGMTFSERHWPWKKGTELLFKITDMSAPKKVGEFKKLVLWTKQQLVEGKKVHCGCIGGHGRTGTFLAALVSEFGEKDAITYVRNNYCHKAVESGSQVKFLGDHFGVKSVEGTKSYGGGKSYISHSGSSTPGKEQYTAIGGSGCIWDKRR